MSAIIPVRLSVVLDRARRLAGPDQFDDQFASTLDGDPIITDIAFDSRRVIPGSMFVCVRGTSSDGHHYAAAAVAAGSAVIVVDHQLPELSDTIQVVVDRTRSAMAYLSGAFFDDPSSRLTTVGITGTNGKTTTAHILQCALDALGSPTGVIGTLSGTHTTPEAPDFQRTLADFVRIGYRSAVAEVSSHALALERVVGTHFRVAVFTNLGHDHLDLHGTQERYFAAKARLFEPDLADEGVTNVDDVHGRLLIDAARIRMTPYSWTDASDIRVNAFDHSFVWRDQVVRVGLGGRFNVMNSVAAATTLGALGYPGDAVAHAMSSVTPVRGRFEPVEVGQDFVVVVDYAHTPDALREVLGAARGVAGSNRVIVVFGCGGDRDHDKRPLMGRVAAECADRVVITSDNPRSEKPLSIINDISAGVPADYRAVTVVEPDRLAAITVALSVARTGDVVVIAGKGHEVTQTTGASVMPFDDASVARTVLAGMS